MMRFLKLALGSLLFAAFLLAAAAAPGLLDERQSTVAVTGPFHNQHRLEARR